MKSNLLKTAKYILIFAFWVLIWQVASMIISPDLSIFLPSPFDVFKKLIILLPTSEFLKACGATLLRIFIGFLLGSTVGILLGILTGTVKIFRDIFSPVLKIVRAVPVVSFIILAFLFLSENKLPVFISFLMVVPLVWQTVNDALLSVNKKLLEMGKVYGVGRFKTLIFIKLPEIKNSIISALLNGIGYAWKSGVAAEVLCNPDISIGKNISLAKANLNFDEIYALTITVVLFSLIFEFLLKYIVNKVLITKEEKFDD